MNKDLEKWLNDANPYRLSQQFDTNAKHFAWEEGATSMAIHLEARQREKEDAGFVVGVEYQKKQPPTEKTIFKVLELFFTDLSMPDIGQTDFDNYATNDLFKRDVNAVIEGIKKNWNNED